LSFCAKEFPNDYIRLANMGKESNSGIVTFNKMMNRQIVVKVRSYFK